MLVIGMHVELRSACLAILVNHTLLSIGPASGTSLFVSLFPVHSSWISYSFWDITNPFVMLISSYHMAGNFEGFLFLDILKNITSTKIEIFIKCS